MWTDTDLVFRIEEGELSYRLTGAISSPRFLYDGARRLAYRGQFDASRPSNGLPVTGADLRAAADAVLAGETPSTDQVPSIGCNIKWRPGNAPS